jgi:hypothetical protein
MEDYMYNNLTGAEYTTIGTTVFGGLTGLLGSKEQRKAAEAQANALIKQGYSQVEVAKIMQETERLKLEQAKAGGGAKTGSPALYIGLGVGAVVILGVVIFAVTRKKA